MGIRSLLLVTSMLAVLATGVAAQGITESLQVQSLAAGCAACHGTRGFNVQGSPLPTLAGMPRDMIIGNLRAFKSGAREGTIMNQIARGYSDDQLEQIAAFFSMQAKSGR